jgi:hypothetical protein
MFNFKGVVAMVFGTKSSTQMESFEYTDPATEVVEDTKQLTLFTVEELEELEELPLIPEEESVEGLVEVPVVKEAMEEPVAETMQAETLVEEPMQEPVEILPEQESVVTEQIPAVPLTKRDKLVAKYGSVDSVFENCLALELIDAGMGQEQTDHINRQNAKDRPVSVGVGKRRQHIATKAVALHITVPQIQVESSLSRDNDAWDKFKQGHRPHQRTAIARCKDKILGKIIIPTGTGKSRIQQDLVTRQARKCMLNNQACVAVLASHRLLLNQQLLDGLVRLWSDCFTAFDIVAVGSDRIDGDELRFSNGLESRHCRITSTTNTEEITQAVADAVASNRHVIIVSTYHSLDRLSCIPDIDIMCYDEAHTVATSRQSDDNFEAHVRKLQDQGIPKRQFFFTATPKVSAESDEEGMNNVAVYGETLYSMSRREAVDLGEIVPVQVQHTHVKRKGNYSTNPHVLAQIIIDAFLKHRECIRQPAQAHDLGAKMLVTLEGIPALKWLVQEYDDLRVWCLQNRVQLFSFSSDAELRCGGFDSNFTYQHRQSRRDLLDRMLALVSEQNAIFLHVDILTEGIDLPAITGVMTFRELQKIKLLQLIGRASRLHPEDRKSLYSVKRSAADYGAMIKPQCWIVLPYMSREKIAANAAMLDIIKQVVKTYKIVEQEFVSKEVFAGATVDPLPVITKPDQKPAVDLNCTFEHLFEIFKIAAPGDKDQAYKKIHKELRRGFDETKLVKLSTTKTEEWYGLSAEERELFTLKERNSYNKPQKKVR